MPKAKIKKPNFIHRIKYRTFSNYELFRYSISCFISGMFFITISTKVEVEAIKNTLSIIGCFAIALSYYFFPFIRDKENLFMKFTRYFMLMVATFLITLILIALCFIENSKYSSNLLIIIIPTSIIDILLIIIFINYSLKPILLIFKNISTTVKTKAKKNKENPIVTYIKSSCLNISVIISFVLSIFSFLATIWNFIKPGIEIIIA